MIKDFFKVSFASFLSNVFSIIKSVVVPYFLGPELFGIRNFLQMVYIFFGFSDLGLGANYTRTVPYYLAKDPREAEEMKGNISFLYMVLGALFCLVLLIYGIFFLDKGMDHYRIVRIGFMLASAELFLSRVYQLYYFDALSRKDFDIIYKSEIAVSFIILAIILLTVKKFSIMAVLTAPIIGNAVYIVLYRKRSYRLDFKFDISRVKPIFKYGFPFFLLSISYWGLKLSDKAIITKFLTFRDLGLYSLGANITMLLQQGFRSLSTVLLPNFQHKLGALNDYSEMGPYIRKYSPYLNVIVAFFLGNFIFCADMIPLLLPSYVDSILIMKILIVTMIIYSTSLLQGLLLTSNVLNKTMQCVVFYFAGILFNIAGSYALIVRGYGITGVACATLASAVLTHGLILGYGHKFYLKGPSVGFYVEFLFPIAVFILGTAAVFFIVRGQLAPVPGFLVKTAVYNTVFFGVFIIFKRDILREVIWFMIGPFVRRA